MIKLNLTEEDIQKIFAHLESYDDKGDEKLRNKIDRQMRLQQ